MGFSKDLRPPLSTAARLVTFAGRSPALPVILTAANLGRNFHVTMETEQKRRFLSKIIVDIANFMGFMGVTWG
jgi:succinylarginine dihydrolase